MKYKGLIQEWTCNLSVVQVNRRLDVKTKDSVSGTRRIEWVFLVTGEQEDRVSSSPSRNAFDQNVAPSARKKGGQQGLSQEGGSIQSLIRCIVRRGVAQQRAEGEVVVLPCLPSHSSLQSHPQTPSQSWFQPPIAFHPPHIHPLNDNPSSLPVSCPPTDHSVASCRTSATQPLTYPSTN